MIGVVVVRSGRLGLGVHDVAGAVDELWLIGSELDTVTSVPVGTTRRIELGDFAPAAWAKFLAAELTGSCVVLASSPDGRDLAGRLAEIWGVELFAGCTQLSASQIATPRYGGATTFVQTTPERFVATVQARNTTGVLFDAEGPVETAVLDSQGDAVMLGELAPDLETVDLADAARIVAGGAGLANEASFGRLSELAPRLGAAMGATRVITDRGWVPFRRQIGTTGATVNPRLYVALGISGAVQHTSGLGAPDHVISVNIDGACPMSQRADLVLIADANETLDELLLMTGEGP